MLTIASVPTLNISMPLCRLRFIPRSIFGPFWLREQYILHFRFLLSVNTLCVRVRVCVCWTQESEGSALVEILRWHSAQSICVDVWVSTDRLALSLSDDRRLACRQHSILKLSFNPELIFFKLKSKTDFASLFCYVEVLAFRLPSLLTVNVCLC